MSKLISNRPAVIAAIKTKQLLALHKTKQTINAVINVLTPVDTGYLAGSYNGHIDKENLIMFFGTSCEYAPFVELGTENQEAQPHLVPAIHGNRRVIEGFFK